MQVKMAMPSPLLLLFLQLTVLVIVLPPPLTPTRAGATEPAKPGPPPRGRWGVGQPVLREPGVPRLRLQGTVSTQNALLM